VRLKFDQDLLKQYGKKADDQEHQRRSQSGKDWGED
jgi:hypothetical protein